MCGYEIIVFGLIEPSFTASCPLERILTVFLIRFLLKAHFLRGMRFNVVWSGEDLPALSRHHCRRPQVEGRLHFLRIATLLKLQACFSHISTSHFFISCSTFPHTSSFFPSLPIHFFSPTFLSSFLPLPSFLSAFFSPIFRLVPRLSDVGQGAYAYAPGVGLTLQWFNTYYCQRKGEKWKKKKIFPFWFTDFSPFLTHSAWNTLTIFSWHHFGSSS